MKLNLLGWLIVWPLWAAPVPYFTDFESGIGTEWSASVLDDSTLNRFTRFTAVIVDDVLADFMIGLGSTNVLSGQTNAIPIQLSCGVGLTNISFILNIPNNRFTNLALQTVAPELSQATIRSAGENRFEILLRSAAGKTLVGTQQLAQLGFRVDSSPSSAIVSLEAIDVQGLQATGRALTNGTGRAGRIFIIGDAPVLDAGPSGAGYSLVLYGRPGSSYEIQSTTNVGAGLPWSTVRRIPLTNSFQFMNGLTNSGSKLFYRVRSD